MLKRGTPGPSPPLEKLPAQQTRPSDSRAVGPSGALGNKGFQHPLHAQARSREHTNPIVISSNSSKSPVPRIEVSSSAHHTNRDVAIGNGPANQQRGAPPAPPVLTTPDVHTIEMQNVDVADNGTADGGQAERESLQQISRRRHSTHNRGDQGHNKRGTTTGLGADGMSARFRRQSHAPSALNAGGANTADPHLRSRQQIIDVAERQQKRLEWMAKTPLDKLRAFVKNRPIVPDELLRRGFDSKDVMALIEESLTTTPILEAFYLSHSPTEEEYLADVYASQSRMFFYVMLGVFIILVANAATSYDDGDQGGPPTLESPGVAVNATFSALLLFCIVLEGVRLFRVSYLSETLFRMEDNSDVMTSSLSPASLSAYDDDEEDEDDDDSDTGGPSTFADDSNGDGAYAAPTSMDSNSAGGGGGGGGGPFLRGGGTSRGSGTANSFATLTRIGASRKSGTTVRAAWRAQKAREVSRTLYKYAVFGDLIATFFVLVFGVQTTFRVAADHGVSCRNPDQFVGYQDSLRETLKRHFFCDNNLTTSFDYAIALIVALRRPTFFPTLVIAVILFIVFVIVEALGDQPRMVPLDTSKTSPQRIVLALITITGLLVIRCFLERSDRRLFANRKLQIAKISQLKFEQAEMQTYVEQLVPKIVSDRILTFQLKQQRAKARKEREAATEADAAVTRQRQQRRDRDESASSGSGGSRSAVVVVVEPPNLNDSIYEDGYDTDNVGDFSDSFILNRIQTTANPLIDGLLKTSGGNANSGSATAEALTAMGRQPLLGSALLKGALASSPITAGIFTSAATSGLGRDYEQGTIILTIGLLDFVTFANNNVASYVASSCSSITAALTKILTDPDRLTTAVGDTATDASGSSSRFRRRGHNNNNRQSPANATADATTSAAVSAEAAAKAAVVVPVLVTAVPQFVTNYGDQIIAIYGISAQTTINNKNPYAPRNVLKGEPYQPQLVIHKGLTLMGKRSESPGGISMNQSVHSIRQGPVTNTRVPQGRQQQQQQADFTPPTSPLSDPHITSPTTALNMLSEANASVEEFNASTDMPFDSTSHTNPPQGSTDGEATPYSAPIISSGHANSPAALNATSPRQPYTTSTSLSFKDLANSTAKAQAEYRKAFRRHLLRALALEASRALADIVRYDGQNDANERMTLRQRKKDLRAAGYYPDNYLGKQAHGPHRKHPLPPPNLTTPRLTFSLHCGPVLGDIPGKSPTTWRYSISGEGIVVGRAMQNATNESRRILVSEEMIVALGPIAMDVTDKASPIEIYSPSPIGRLSVAALATTNSMRIIDEAISLANANALLSPGGGQGNNGSGSTAIIHPLIGATPQINGSGDSALNGSGCPLPGYALPNQLLESVSDRHATIGQQGNKLNSSGLSAPSAAIEISDGRGTPVQPDNRNAAIVHPLSHRHPNSAMFSNALNSVRGQNPFAPAPAAAADQTTEANNNDHPTLFPIMPPSAASATAPPSAHHSSTTGTAVEGPLSVLSVSNNHGNYYHSPNPIINTSDRFASVSTGVGYNSSDRSGSPASPFPSQTALHTHFASEGNCVVATKGYASVLLDLEYDADFALVETMEKLRVQWMAELIALTVQQREERARDEELQRLLRQQQQQQQMLSSDEDAKMSNHSNSNSIRRKKGDGKEKNKGKDKFEQSHEMSAKSAGKRELLSRSRSARNTNNNSTNNSARGSPLLGALTRSSKNITSLELDPNTNNDKAATTGQSASENPPAQNATMQILSECVESSKALLEEVTADTTYQLRMTRDCCISSKGCACLCLNPPGDSERNTSDSSDAMTVTSKVESIRSGGGGGEGGMSGNNHSEGSPTNGIQLQLRRRKFRKRRTDRGGASMKSGNPQHRQLQKRYGGPSTLPVGGSSNTNPVSASGSRIVEDPNLFTQNLSVGRTDYSAMLDDGELSDESLISLRQSPPPQGVDNKDRVISLLPKGTVPADEKPPHSVDVDVDDINTSARNGRSLTRTLRKMFPRRSLRGRLGRGFIRPFFDAVDLGFRQWVFVSDAVELEYQFSYLYQPAQRNSYIATEILLILLTISKFVISMTDFFEVYPNDLDTDRYATYTPPGAVNGSSPSVYYLFEIDSSDSFFRSDLDYKSTAHIASNVLFAISFLASALNIFLRLRGEKIAVQARNEAIAKDNELLEKAAVKALLGGEEETTAIPVPLAAAVGSQVPEDEPIIVERSADPATEAKSKGNEGKNKEEPAALSRRDRKASAVSSSNSSASYRVDPVLPHPFPSVQLWTLYHLLPRYLLPTLKQFALLLACFCAQPTRIGLDNIGLWIFFVATCFYCGWPLHNRWFLAAAVYSLSLTFVVCAIVFPFSFLRRVNLALVIIIVPMVLLALAYSDRQERKSFVAAKLREAFSAALSRQDGVRRAVTENAIPKPLTKLFEELKATALAERGRRAIEAQRRLEAQQQSNGNGGGGQQGGFNGGVGNHPTMGNHHNGPMGMPPANHFTPGAAGAVTHLPAAVTDMAAAPEDEDDDLLFACVEIDFTVIIRIRFDDCCGLFSAYKFSDELLTLREKQLNQIMAPLRPPLLPNNSNSNSNSKRRKSNARSINNHAVSGPQFAQPIAVPAKHGLVVKHPLAANNAGGLNISSHNGPNAVNRTHSNLQNSQGPQTLLSIQSPPGNGLTPTFEVPSVVASTSAGTVATLTTGSGTGTNTTATNTTATNTDASGDEEQKLLSRNGTAVSLATGGGGTLNLAPLPLPPHQRSATGSNVSKKSKNIMMSNTANEQFFPASHQPSDSGAGGGQHDPRFVAEVNASSTQMAPSTPMGLAEYGGLPIPKAAVEWSQQQQQQPGTGTSTLAGGGSNGGAGGVSSSDILRGNEDLSSATSATNRSQVTTGTTIVVSAGQQTLNNSNNLGIAGSYIGGGGGGRPSSGNNQNNTSILLGSIVGTADHIGRSMSESMESNTAHTHGPPGNRPNVLGVPGQASHPYNQSNNLRPNAVTLQGGASLGRSQSHLHGSTATTAITVPSVATMASIVLAQTRMDNDIRAMASVHRAHFRSEFVALVDQVVAKHPLLTVMEVQGEELVIGGPWSSNISSLAEQREASRKAHHKAQVAANEAAAAAQHKLNQIRLIHSDNGHSSSPSGEHSPSSGLSLNDPLAIAEAAAKAAREAADKIKAFDVVKANPDLFRLPQGKSCGDFLVEASSFVSVLKKACDGLFTFTAITTADDAIIMLRNSLYPSFDVLGTGPLRCRELIRAAAPGTIAFTESFVSNFSEEVCEKDRLLGTDVTKKIESDILANIQPQKSTQPAHPSQKLISPHLQPEGNESAFPKPLEVAQNDNSEQQQGAHFAEVSSSSASSHEIDLTFGLNHGEIIRPPFKQDRRRWRVRGLPYARMYSFGEK